MRRVRHVDAQIVHHMMQPPTLHKSQCHMLYMVSNSTRSYYTITCYTITCYFCHLSARRMRHISHVGSLRQGGSKLSIRGLGQLRSCSDGYIQTPPPRRYSDRSGVKRGKPTPSLLVHSPHLHLSFPFCPIVALTSIDCSLSSLFRVLCSRPVTRRRAQDSRLLPRTLHLVAGRSISTLTPSLSE